MTDAGPADNAATQPPGYDRITVGLIPKAVDGLQNLQDSTGLSKTVLVQRAISLYEFISRQIDAGHDVTIRNPASDETQTVLLL